MDSTDDRLISVDVRLPDGTITAFRTSAGAAKQRTSSHARAMVTDFLQHPGLQRHVPHQFHEDRRLTVRLPNQMHHALAEQASAWGGVPVSSLLRLVIEEALNGTRKC